MDFKTGDVVRLKSGGPKMSVEQTGERAMTGGESVWCVWFELVGRQQLVKRDTFPPEVLEIAKESGPIQFGVARR